MINELKLLQSFYFDSVLEEGVGVFRSWTKGVEPSRSKVAGAGERGPSVFLSWMEMPPEDSRRRGDSGTSVFLSCTLMAGEDGAGLGVSTLSTGRRFPPRWILAISSSCGLNTLGASAGPGPGREPAERRPPRAPPAMAAMRSPVPPPAGLGAAEEEGAAAEGRVVAFLRDFPAWI